MCVSLVTITNQVRERAHSWSFHYLLAHIFPGGIIFNVVKAVSSNIEMLRLEKRLATFSQWIVRLQKSKIM